MDFDIRYRNCDFAPDNNCDQNGSCDSCDRVQPNAAWRYETGYDLNSEQYILFIDVFTSDKGILSVADIAQDLGMSERSVRKYFADGRLEGFKSAGKWMITEEKYNRYQENLGE